MNTPTEKSKIYRVTERQSFKECRRRWFYEYKKNITLKDKPPGARELGTAWHAAMETYYKTLLSNPQDAESEAWGTWVKESAELEEDQRDLGTGMLSHYFEHYLNDPLLGDPVLVEKRMYAKVPGTRNCFLTGKVDLIVRINGELWVVDHKSLRAFYPTATMEMKDQVTAYIWLARQNGYDVKGAIYNMALKRVPKAPKLLKNGSLSKDKDQVTTKKLYRETVLNEGLNLEDYEEFIETELKPTEFFRQERIYRSNAHIDNFEKHLTEEIKEMSSKNTPIYPHDHDWCMWCDFRNLCFVENNLDGSESSKRSFNYTVMSSYKKNTEREVV